MTISNDETTTRLSQPIKWWGGKHYLAKQLIGLMPAHLHYVEPFFGGGAVLLEKDPLDPAKFVGDKSYERGVSEVVNDLDGRLVNFWRTIQDEQAFDKFRRIVEATPFCQAFWDESKQRETPASPSEADPGAAAAFFVRCRQSRAGGFKDFATLSRNRTRRKMNEQASAWWTAVEGLPAVHARLKRVVILNDDAIRVIEAQDGERTLFYLDPPYLHETRASTDAYRHEMTAADHGQMLDTIKQCQGKVMLSGYPNPLYDGQLAGWNRKDIPIDNKAAGGKTKRVMTESVWMNV